MAKAKSTNAVHLQTGDLFANGLGGIVAVQYPFPVDKGSENS